MKNCTTIRGNEKKKQQQKHGQLTHVFYQHTYLVHWHSINLNLWYIEVKENARF